MGNCLLKSDKKAEARIYLRRSIVFSSGSIEGFKAQSDLEKSSKVPTSLSEASDQDLLDIFPGKWVFSVGGGGGQFVMEREGDHVNILGKWKELFGGCKMHGKLVGKNLTMGCDGQAAFTGHAVTLTTFEGSWVGYNWTLSKQ